MREKLAAYGLSSAPTTLVPWALAEPETVATADAMVRDKLFGGAALGLLYSGSFGRGHSYEAFLALARRLHAGEAHFAFAVRGNRAAELKSAIQPEDQNVSIADFVPEADLPRHLTAADIHLVSLQPHWTGIVVPSKFFGALAAGRPVLFAGARPSAIARWIEEYQLGWILDEQSQDAVAAELRTLVASPEKLAELQRRCHAVYQQRFARRRITEEWHRLLSSLLSEPLE
jgi:glycosyltransferase involved in cell wall biosynthesis